MINSTRTNGWIWRNNSIKGGYHAQEQIQKKGEGDTKTPTQTSTQKEEEVMSKKKRKNLEASVEHYLRKWSDILNLRDWDIDLFIVEERLPDACDQEKAGGCIYHCYEHHEAQIYLLHPEKWKDLNDGGFWEGKNESHLENIIVHELLHLHMTHHRFKKEWQVEREELAINQLTKAFMFLNSRAYPEDGDGA